MNPDALNVVFQVNTTKVNSSRDGEPKRSVTEPCLSFLKENIDDFLLGARIEKAKHCHPRGEKRVPWKAQPGELSKPPKLTAAQRHSARELDKGLLQPSCPALRDEVRETFPWVAVPFWRLVFLQ